jgi:accessory gene regulator B
MAVLTALSIFFGMFYQFLVFWGFYFPLRHFAGGYHASSAAKCFFFSVVMLLGVFSCLKYLPWSSTLYLSIALVSVAIIAFLAPVADANKPLDADESRVFGRIARIVLLLEVILFSILWYNGANQAVSCITLSFAVLAGMLILGKGKESLGANSDQDEAAEC